MPFSENLQFIRAQAGLTQEQLAEQLDVTRQSVSKWEGGQSFPEMDTILKICDLYDTNLDTLLRGSVEESRVGDTARYDAFMNRFARQISGAVAGIIGGVGLTAILEGLGLAEVWLGTLFLLIISVCVVVLVVAGLQMENFCKKHPVIADFYTEEQREGCLSFSINKFLKLLRSFENLLSLSKRLFRQAGGRRAFPFPPFSYVSSLGLRPTAAAPQRTPPTAKTHQAFPHRSSARPRPT